MTSMRPGFKTVKIEELKCYLPTIKVYENKKRLYTRILKGDPLVNKRDAIKYAQIEINYT
jgi:hypothetical protein